jgi:hypothetical protein
MGTQENQQKQLVKIYKKKMTIKEWLSNVKYDDFGQILWNVDKNGEHQMVAEIRGWGRIQNEFKTEKEAIEFQDEVGKFIAEAINEKIQKLK